MANPAERDAAAAEFGFASERLMAVVTKLDNDELSKVVEGLFNGWAHYLETQDEYLAETVAAIQVLHEKQMEEVRLRLVSR